MPDSYFDNLSKCELIDVDVVRDATLHAQKIADKMVEERLSELKKENEKLKRQIQSFNPFPNRPNPRSVNPYDSKAIKRTGRGK